MLALIRTKPISIARPVVCTSMRFYSPFGSHISDNDPIVLEREKLRAIQGKTESLLETAPKWNEALASDSEAFVKADREPDKPFKIMQEKTINAIENPVD